jgi:hypothetical protein
MGGGKGRHSGVSALNSCTLPEWCPIVGDGAWREVGEHVETANDLREMNPTRRFVTRSGEESAPLVVR